MNLLRLLLTLTIFNVVNAADLLSDTGQEETKSKLALVSTYTGQIDKIVTVRDALEGFNAMLPSIVLGSLFWETAHPVFKTICVLQIT